MKHIKLSIFIFYSIFSISLFAQTKNVVSGAIVNIENDEPLPFASITLVNYPIGTISNENGEFDFYIPKSKQNDTLSISFIGFNPYLIPLKNITGSLKIKLQSADNILDEVILSKLSPLDYIKKALDNIDQNYPQDPYQSIAYYREKFIENDRIIGKKEAVFKTYYPSIGNSVKKENQKPVKNQHQLLLYRPADNPQKFQFMRDWIDKKIEKEKKKSIKKGEDFDEDFDLEKDMSMGGPETIINMADIRNGSSNNNFLNPKHFKKYEYSFGEETTYNGEVLVTIHYKAKRKIESIKDHGKILISKGDYAIALIKGSGVLSIPIMAKPIFFLVGLSISNPKFRNTVSYQKYKDKWYPKLFRWDATISLKKRHAFSANEHADLKIGQVFFINKLDSLVSPIPEDKRFDSKENMEDQLYNDLNISWQGMNVIKN